ncbi:MAG: hypothetical protein IPP05_21550 [Cytophagaceae bacterium]|nr:hypothetical protein [Cytophagaceae bacterium]
MSTAYTSVCKKVATGLDDSVQYAGLLHNDIGVMRAALTPQNGRILNALYPEKDNGSLSFKKVGSKSYPVVLHRWRTPGTTGSVKTARSCEGTTGMATLVEEELVIDSYVELGFQLDEVTINTICEEYQQFEANHAAKSSVRSSVGGSVRSTINAELADRVKAMLVEINDQGAEALSGGVGTNKLYPDPDNAGEFLSTPQEVKLYNLDDPQQGMLKAFKTELSNIGRKNKLAGRPIIVTDSMSVVNWFEDVCGISCCSDAGIDYSRLINQPYELYYSESITQYLEADRENIVIFYPESFFLMAVDEFRNLKAGLQGSGMKHNRTTFGNFSILEPSMRISDISCIQEVQVPRLTFDLRAIENDCVGDDKTFTTDFIPSLLFKYKTAPANADGVTGIFHYVVDNGVAP